VIDGVSAIEKGGRSSPPPLLDVQGLCKRFGAINALDDVSLAVQAGEVHGLVGANGAGKSTLVKILAGSVSPDAGDIRIRGIPTRIRNPEDAGRHGLAFIHQELNLVPHFSVLQNMALGMPNRRGLAFVDWPSIRARAQSVARTLDMRFSLDLPIEDLSVAERWLVSIGKSLMFDASTIVMDEPTASLSAEESDRLFGIIGELASTGVAIIYVSHRLTEVARLCDRVSVLKDGRCVADIGRSELSRDTLVRAIVGTAIETVSPPSEHVTRRETALAVADIYRSPRVRGVSFDVRSGEVVGLAGLVGSGRTELLRVLFGADTPDAGSMLLHGRHYAPRNTHEAVHDGVGLVPEERRSEGLILRESIRFNVNLASWERTVRSRWLHLIDQTVASEKASQAIEQLGIVCQSMSDSVGRLSGGNQQKVVMAKWLALRPRVLLLDEPTRGVDVGARSEIYRIIRQLADGGVAVLIVSSEFAELVACDRVLVMREGRIVSHLDSGHISESTILRACYGSLGPGED